MGAELYLRYLRSDGGTIVDIFEQFSAPTRSSGAPTQVSPDQVIHRLHKWDDGSLLDLVPSRLELAWTLKNPTEKAQLLPQFLSKVASNYDLVLIDCAPTESILSTAAYRSSRFVVVPVRPEFLATIGLPLLERSLGEHRLRYQDQELTLAGVVFNGGKYPAPPEQQTSRSDVRRLAGDYGWKVFESEAWYSDSYPAGSRSGSPIFNTKYARDYVKKDFALVGKEFCQAVGFYA
jgi:chromosome partitioning protein